jgi:hypothetical protein
MGYACSKPGTSRKTWVWTKFVGKAVNVRHRLP